MEIEREKPNTLISLKSFTDVRETFLQASTLYDTPAYSNGHSLLLTSRFPWTFSNFQWLIKAHSYEHPNVALTQTFTGVIRP
ncbi:hypothetical protein TNCV_5088461 [Trichonephila clavipes]|nr:hypothetical protein TNCV_5088461 [Trichonephila clavipes]